MPYIHTHSDIDFNQILADEVGLSLGNTDNNSEVLLFWK